jgi:hypothetical protein
MPDHTPVSDAITEAGPTGKTDDKHFDFTALPSHLRMQTYEGYFEIEVPNERHLPAQVKYDLCLLSVEQVVERLAPTSSRENSSCAN